jgi:drug/metabolite transporter (DMT)-like permease
LTVSVGPDRVAGTRPTAQDLTGVGLVILAAVGWSIENTLSTPLSRRYALKPFLAVKLVGGATVIAAASLAFTGGVLPPRDVWAPVLYNGTVGIVAAVFCFFFALRTVGATRTVVLFSSAGLWGALGGWLLLNEALTAAHVAGGALMILGVAWLANLAPGGATPKHTPPGP